jgi:hypothetical protein
MDTLQCTKIFNQIMDEFFRELIDLLPDQPQINVQYNLFQGLCKTNIRKPCSQFMLGAIPYLEKIAMKDENFFLSQDKPKLLTKLKFDVIWVGLSDNNKDIIWKYIKNFFVVGIKAVEMPPETLPTINFIINN